MNTTELLAAIRERANALNTRADEATERLKAVQSALMDIQPGISYQPKKGLGYMRMEDMPMKGGWWLTWHDGANPPINVLRTDRQTRILAAEQIDGLLHQILKGL